MAQDYRKIDVRSSDGPVAEQDRQGVANFLREAAALSAASDNDGLEKLFHPSWRACLDDETEAFFEKSRALGYRLLAAATAEAVVDFPDTPGESSGETLPGGEGPSVAPTHTARFVIRQVEKQGADSAEFTSSFTQYPRLEDDRWSLVRACPTPEETAMFKALGARSKSRREKAQDLIEALDEKDRGKIENLIRQNEKFRAAEIIRKSGEADLATAMTAVGIVAKTLPDEEIPLKGDDSLPSDPKVRALHQAYASAIASGTPSALTELLHPSSRKCAEGLSDDVLRQLREDHFRTELPMRFFLGIRPIEDTDRATLGGSGAYPVESTDVAVIGYPSDGQHREIVKPAILHEGDWRLVERCPGG